jgi:hypothetical protein
MLVTHQGMVYTVRTVADLLCALFEQLQSLTTGKAA